MNVSGGQEVGVGVSVYCYSRGQLGGPMLPVSTTLDSVGLDVLIPKGDMCPHRKSGIKLWAMVSPSLFGLLI